MSPSHSFANAHDFNIGSLSISNANSSRDLETAFQNLYDNIAIEAAHDSAERHDAPACHEDTRKAVQEEIHSWITDGDEDAEPKKILSLMGPAGTGKTAIAGSIADTCDDLGLLAGSFFFASFAPSEARRSKRFLVTTLVYHLISSLDDEHPLLRAVLMAVQRDPSIFRKKLEVQFKVLLIKPFTNTRHQFDVSTLPKVFIVDGLDEVEAANSRHPERDAHEVRLENEADQEEILSALLYAANSNAFPFRIIVASRPERVITTFFSSSADGTTRTIFLDEKYDPDFDIRLYLDAKFAEIRRRYRLPSSWPSEEEIGSLVYDASGQFVYAVTIVRFLQSGRHPNPQGLLDSIRCSRVGELGALAPLDALYTRIIRSSPDVPLALRWIYVINLFTGHPALFLNQFLQDYVGQANYLLENLASLLWIPPVEDQPSSYRFHHKSFLDFFEDEMRCGKELSLAFRAGYNFYLTRSPDIYKNKSPTVPIPESQQVHFMDYFLRAERTSFCPDAISEPSIQEKLVKCDVVWWVHRVLTLWPSAIGDLSNTWWSSREMIEIWFTVPHGVCEDGNCLPVCKHWRSNILRALKGLGWSVPNVIALFREALDLKISSPWSLFPYFLPPDEPLQTADIHLLPALTRYTVDEEYQATLDLVAAMRSRLPADWKSQFELEYQHDQYAQYRGFTAVIEKIRQELAIEAPDILCYVSGPHPEEPPIPVAVGPRQPIEATPSPSSDHSSSIDRGEV